MWSKAIEILEEEQRLRERKMSKHQCDYCERPLVVGEDVIKYHGEMYCTDCVTEASITYYTLDGDYIGDENELGFESIEE